MQDTGGNREKERAILIGAYLPEQSRWECEDLLEELRRLAETAGAEVVHTEIQAIQRPDPAFFIGTGKVAEIELLNADGAFDVAFFNNNLTPVQQKNLEAKLNLKVIDRTGLILDIFAQRALTREGKLQVELAQLHYLLPRLTRMWTHLSRLGGGIGTRGPGETQLETDRRRIKTRIHRIQKDLKDVIRHRQQLRKTRKGVPVPVVALIGYTNSGKSTLFQALTGSETIVEDKLFATLDPLVRQIKLTNQQTVLLLDTVGFIRELPTQLVAAFKATLEEIQTADVLLHIVDISHPHYRQQMETVDSIITDLKITHLPIISVFNKIDSRSNSESLLHQQSPMKERVYISALRNQGLERLREVILDVIMTFRRRMSVTVFYSANDIINFIHRHAKITSAEYEEKSVTFSIELDSPKAAMLQKLIEESGEHPGE